jgi:hypothetical protein
MMPMASSLMLNITGRFLLQSFHSFVLLYAFCEFVTFFAPQPGFHLTFIISNSNTNTPCSSHFGYSTKKILIKDPCRPVVKNLSFRI